MAQMWGGLQKAGLRHSLGLPSPRGLVVGGHPKTEMWERTWRLGVESEGSCPLGVLTPQVHKRLSE